MAKHACSGICLRGGEGGLLGVEVLLVCEPNLSCSDKEGWRWQLPGGKCCESKVSGNCCIETPEETVIRECSEETGYIVAPKKLIFCRIFGTHKQCVFFTEITGGEPLKKRVFNRETPQWFLLNRLPRSLFPSHRKIIRDFVFSWLWEGA